MDEQIKDQWIQALRSGVYHQTTKTLKDAAGFCCLGVLCELHRQMTGRGRWDTNGDYIANGERSDGGLPIPVVQWAGVSSKNPLLWTSPGRWETAAALNDQGMSFLDIASCIEAEPHV